MSLIAVEQIGEVIQVIPQEQVSERTVERKERAGVRDQ